MLRSLFVMIVLVSSAFADPTQRVNGKLAYYGENFSARQVTRAELRDILAAKHTSRAGKFDVIGSCNTSAAGKCYQHSAVGYSRARVIMFGELFMEQDRSGTYVTEVYCNRKVYFRDPSQVSGMHAIVNIEHTWPQSKFSPSYNKELQKSDMHHLFPSDSKANSVRANHVFGEPANPGFMGADLCEPSNIDNSGNGFVFTPPDEHKGNVARALFYFAVRYDMEITSREEKFLREWHELDPVDAEERTRNDQISTHQGNRNPFVDFPEMVDLIQNF